MFIALKITQKSKMIRECHVLVMQLTFELALHEIHIIFNYQEQIYNSMF
jgi:hypothetical protein